MATDGIGIHTLLDKVIAHSLSDEERVVLVKKLQNIEQDHSRYASERMAAIVLRASLEARAAHVDH